MSVLTAVLLAEESRTLQRLLEAAFGVDAADAAAFRAWLGRGRQEDGAYCTNAFAAWRSIILATDSLKGEEEKGSIVLSV